MLKFQQTSLLRTSVFLQTLNRLHPMDNWQTASTAELWTMDCNQHRPTALSRLTTGSVRLHGHAIANTLMALALWGKGKGLYHKTYTRETAARIVLGDDISAVSVHKEPVYHKNFATIFFSQALHCWRLARCPHLVCLLPWGASG